MKKTLLLIASHLSLLLGIIGAFLPILPTVPFLLLAAFGYSKSSVKLHNWILNHKYLGPPLLSWEKSGAIGLKAKILASFMICAVSLLRIQILEIPIAIKTLVFIILIMVLIFIWTRPTSKN